MNGKPFEEGRKIGEKPIKIPIKLTKEDIPRLREQWRSKCSDLFQVPLALPPFREINHEIKLIDEDKRIRYRLPKCPDILRDQLVAKIDRYTEAGWWRPTTTAQAVPMICTFKITAEPKLRTVFDLRQQNENTVKDVTPFPDQDNIRNDVARAPFRSKLDLTEAYEQVRILEKDVGKTAFSTIFGTFESLVMQQGDCNAPSTFQRLMTRLFFKQVGKSVHVYLDDIFIFSYTLEDHERHLGEVFDVLRKAKLYLSASKFDVYSKSMDCLGHVIDDAGIHADEEKMQCIRDWRTPQSFGEIQRFLGLVQYIAHFMPDVSAYTTPLANAGRQHRPFQWTPLLDKCFNSIKQLACKTPILKPIDPKSNEPIWVVTDGSQSGVGAYYGQGLDWKTCQPAGFLSKKFTPAQRNYRTHEHETIAILEALSKWEDKLLGVKFNLATDNEGLEYFKTQSKLTSRQLRWADYLSRFNFDVKHVEGITNRVADALSRYYTEFIEGDEIPSHRYVSIDARIDPELETLPLDRKAEAETMRRIAAVRRSTRLQDKRNTHGAEPDRTRGLNAPINAGLETPPDLEALDAPTSGKPFSTILEEDLNIIPLVKQGYALDSTFSKVLEHSDAHPRFKIRDGLIWTTNQLHREVLCIPFAVKHNGRRLVEIIIDHAHNVMGHFGHYKTTQYVRRTYWWPSMTGDIETYCRTCGQCQTTKDSNTRPAGLLVTLPVPDRPWQSVGLDFMGPLPPSNSYDYLLVVIDRFTSMVHLIPTTVKVTASQVASLFLNEVVRLHGVPDSIVSDRDSKFTSIFWKELHRILGVKLLMSTSFHPQTDGATERANRSIGQVLRAVVSNDQANWADKCPMVELAINSSISATTGFAPFELNYGFIPQVGITGREYTKYHGVRAFARQARWNILAAHDAIIEQRVKQTHSANKLRRESPPYKTGDMVYLSTKNINFPKGRARKLIPRFIGPYRVTAANNDSANVTLELPEDLKKRKVHSTFHISLIRPHEPNDDEKFPRRDTHVTYELGDDDEAEWFVDEIIGHQWDAQGKLELRVQWTLGDVTWEPLQNCNELEALDRYLELHGAKTPHELPRRKSK
jgi:transposase InsO family protein